MHSLLQVNVTSLLLNVDQPVMFACSAWLPGPRLMYDAICITDTGRDHRL